MHPRQSQRILSLLYCVENGFNPTSEVQIMGNGHFKMARFETPHMQTAIFQMRLQLPLVYIY